MTTAADLRPTLGLPPKPWTHLAKVDVLGLGTSRIKSDFDVTNKYDPSYAVFLSEGLGLDDLIAYLLAESHWGQLAEYDNAGAGEAEMIWRRDALVAVVRQLSDGRREVIRFDGPELERVVYAPHPEFEATRAKCLEQVAAMTLQAQNTEDEQP